MNIDQVQESEIDLPELNCTELWKQNNPDVDPMSTVPPDLMAVILENGRTVTFIDNLDEDTDSTLMPITEVNLPFPPEILRAYLSSYKELEVCTRYPNKLVFAVPERASGAADGLWTFENLRKEAKDILDVYYPMLWNVLVENGSKVSMARDGIRCHKNGVDLSEHYFPENIIVGVITALTLGVPFVFNEHIISTFDKQQKFIPKIILPEIEGVPTSKMLAEYFNDRMELFAPTYKEHGIFTGFCAPNVEDTGIDVITVDRDGRGVFAFIPTHMALYMYGTKTVDFIVENDPTRGNVISCKPTNVFACASAASYIDFTAFAETHNLKAN